MGRKKCSMRSIARDALAPVAPTAHNKVALMAGNTAMRESAIARAGADTLTQAHLPSEPASVTQARAAVVLHMMTVIGGVADYIRRTLDRQIIESSAWYSPSPARPPWLARWYLNSYTKTCSIKGGEHESNHVRWCIDLGRNVFYQACHNQLCNDKVAAWVCRRALIPTDVRWAMRKIDVLFAFAPADQTYALEQMRTSAAEFEQGQHEWQDQYTTGISDADLIYEHDQQTKDARQAGGSEDAGSRDDSRARNKSRSRSRSRERDAVTE